MARPVKCRRICCDPDSLCFKPVGIPSYKLEKIEMTIDELEALRLADFEGKYQEEAAKSMGVSRQTFGNIVEAARYKTADAVMNGKLLSIKGGNVIRKKNRR